MDLGRGTKTIGKNCEGEGNHPQEELKCFEVLGTGNSWLMLRSLLDWAARSCSVWLGGFGLSVTVTAQPGASSTTGVQVKAVELAGCNWVHGDVLDGHFVPNITIGPRVIAALWPMTDLSLDVHLSNRHSFLYDSFCLSVYCSEWASRCDL